ncbi:hypothetical protein RJ640_020683 [Escallonia rubra]|uniref:Uncharacterized protein n=1 Tax=Escallonia rubra TaxID=112253 RepID=A0AA88UN41_9ASTE|nr:hypothetical protein RJ640_020683 [Escallonia rubra]
MAPERREYVKVNKICIAIIRWTFAITVRLREGKVAPATELEPAGNSPHFSHLASRICRQDGHEEWDPSHVSIQPTWNPWPHCGNTLISSPTINSARQMAQSENFPASFSEKVSLGRDLNTFFFSPLFAAGGFVARPVILPEILRIQAQRATATRPSTHMRAHSRAARMTTKSEPKLSSSSGSGSWWVAGDEELASARNLERRVICEERGEAKREGGREKDWDLKSGNDVLMCLNQVSMVYKESVTCSLTES